MDHLKHALALIFDSLPRIGVTGRRAIVALVALLASWMLKEGVGISSVVFFISLVLTLDFMFEIATNRHLHFHRRNVDLESEKSRESAVTASDMHGEHERNPEVR